MKLIFLKKKKIKKKIDIHLKIKTKIFGEKEIFQTVKLIGECLLQQ